MVAFMTVLQLVLAGPNPIKDNESDEDREENVYKYPDFEKSSHPYWRAFPMETRIKLKQHDHLELDVLGHFRPLDFKLREAWTRTDKPFAASK